MNSFSGSANDGIEEALKHFFAISFVFSVKASGRIACSGEGYGLCLFIKSPLPRLKEKPRSRSKRKGNPFSNGFMSCYGRYISTVLGEETVGKA